MSAAVFRVNALSTAISMLVLLLAICAFGTNALAERDDVATAAPLMPSPYFEEQFSFRADLETKARVYFNAPREMPGKPSRTTRLIIYALPNGNTIEQTLGCKMSTGLDWHHDIQHVAAQVRLLRSLSPDERIVLICAEAPGLSWPNFRKTVSNANARIRAFVEEWRNQFKANSVLLTGHSGGGAFMFGVIDADDDIPAYIDRIAFLDANYSFDAKQHATKLERWLRADDARRLIVVAYDDREITYNGKKVVGPDGGTYRATSRMEDALGKTFDISKHEKPPFYETIGLNGRIRFYVHPNPENKILHTALVGEMNGLVHVATLGTPHEEKWGTFGGPRAYTKWIQPAPTTADHPQPAKNDEAKPASRLATNKNQQLPERLDDAVGGRAFIETIRELSLDEREAAILREITRGNFPNFLRDFKTIAIRATAEDGKQAHEIETRVDVMPDYLAIGSDDDFVRMPMTPQTAQRIADAFGCILPTRKLVDTIDAQAELHVAPHPMTVDRESVDTFYKHHNIVEKQRGGKPLGLLITGIKKDIVLSPRIFERPERLAIYGWRHLDGKPIQPLTIVHWNRYVDYSHGVRLIRNTIEVDGKTMRIDELLSDPARCSLVSDEGPMSPPRYPTE